MTARTVTSTDFRAKAGVYLDDAARAPVIITKHNRPARVLLDVEEYERLLAFARAHDGQPEAAEARPGVSPEMERLIRERAEVHRETLMELAKR